MRKTVVIVDDEEDARELLKVHLARHPHLELIGEARNGEEALSLLNSQVPDVVLLDIQMPELSGIQVAQQLTHAPVIVFVTAYDEFAVQAFELNAVDYLLKPFSKDRFDATMQKILAISAPSMAYEDLIANLADRLDSRPKHLQRFAYRSGAKTLYIPVADVIMIESADQYVEVHTATDKYLLRLSMDYLESAMDPQVFFRSHRSYFIRIDHVLSIEQFEPRNYLIHLKGGLQARLTRDKRDLLNQLLLER